MTKQMWHGGPEEESNMHYFAKQSKTGVAHQKQRVMCYTQSYAIQSKTEENRSGTPEAKSLLTCAVSPKDLPEAIY